MSTTNDSQCDSSCNEDCQSLTSLYTAITALSDTMRQSIRHFVKRTYDLIPDIYIRTVHDRRPTTNSRRVRAPLAFVGSASSWLFGVATESDIKGLQDAILKVQAQAELAAADATRTRNGLATFARLENERMDRFHAILQQDQQSIANLYQNVKAAHETATLEINALAVMTRELAKFVSLHDDAQELALGVDELVHGQLTPKLISARQITDIVRDANIELAKLGARLCYNSPREVYAMRNFDFARAQQDMVIRIRMPYSRHPRFTLYRTLTWPLPVPGNQGYITHLQAFPRHIIADYATGLVGELTEAPKSAVVDVTDVIWHYPNTGSCLYEILADDIGAAHQACPFIMKREEIVPSFMRLVAGVYILTNYSNVRTGCKGKQPTAPTTEVCAPCLLQLDCGCFLQTNGTLITKETQGCESDSAASTSVLHGVNLALLQSFYKITNQSLSSRVLFAPENLKRPQPLELPIFGHNVTKVLAADSAAGYSLA